MREIRKQAERAQYLTRMAYQLETMDTAQLVAWLESKGFGAAIQWAFEGEVLISYCMQLEVVYS